MATKIRGISEVALWVHEMGASVRFYRDVLGLTVISPPNVQDQVVLEAGGPPSGVPQMVVLMQLPPESREFGSPRQLHHLIFEISPKDFDGEVERMKSEGQNVRLGKHLVIPARTLLLEDPDGNEVELIAKRDW